MLLIDTTFSDPHWKFPSKAESIRQIITLIEDHPTECQVYLEGEMLGIEPILVVLAKRFRTKVS